MFDGKNLPFLRREKEWITHNVKKEFRTHTRTSTLESVSTSLRLISLAMEKKTSSTFKFVFALCRIFLFVWAEQNDWYFKCTLHLNSILPLTVSKNLMPYSSARAWPLEVGTAYKKKEKISFIVNNIEHMDMHMNAERENEERIIYELVSTQAFKATGSHIDPQIILLSYF